MADRGRFVLGRQHDAGPARQRRQRGPHVIQKRTHILVVLRQRGIDPLAVGFGKTTGLQEPVDEKAQACLRRHAPGRHMRTVQKAQKFQVLHHVAHCRGRDAFGHRARQRARAHRLSGRKIAFHDAAEYFAGPVGHVRQHPRSLLPVEVLRRHGRNNGPSRVLVNPVARHPKGCAPAPLRHIWRRQMKGNIHAPLRPRT